MQNISSFLGGCTVHINFVSEPNCCFSYLF